jgi:hypothetical protein
MSAAYRVKLMISYAVTLRIRRGIKFEDLAQKGCSGNSLRVRADSVSASAPCARGLRRADPPQTGCDPGLGPPCPRQAHEASAPGL